MKSHDYFEYDQGNDNLREGSADSGDIVPLSAPQIPLYCVGSEGTKVTAPSLYPNGVGDPNNVVAFSHVNDALGGAREELMKGGNDLSVVSGFLSPFNQNARWKILFNTQPRDTLEQILNAGRYADSAGSVAMLEKEETDLNVMIIGLADFVGTSFEALRVELSKLADKQNSTSEKIASELTMYLANSGVLAKEIKVETATSVHNLGHSVNVVLTKDGQPCNMGIGIDTVSPVQAVDYFTKVRPAQYEEEVDRDPLLREYLASLGVKKVDEKLITEIAENRWALFQALREMGATFYRGEQGHFSFPPKDGGELPSRQYVYDQATRHGYRVM